MKAVCFSSYNKSPNKVLEVKTIPKPFIDKCKPNDSDQDRDRDQVQDPVQKQQQVLIKVHACALNPLDKIRLNGDLAMILPEQFDTENVLGYDLSGVIEEVSYSFETGTGTGDGDGNFKVGDEVFVRLAPGSNGIKYGALAEYVVCNVVDVGRKPKNISFEEAAAIPLSGLAAFQCLLRGGVKEGSKVFIPGGAGGVGSLAIQIAKKVFKAGHVCTTAGPGKGTALCHRMGADRVINYKEEDFEITLKGEDFDMVLDTMNEASKMGGLLKPGVGKVISISGPPTVEAIEDIMDGRPVPFVVKAFMWLTRNRKAERAAKHADGSWEYLSTRSSGKELNELASYLESGEIKAVIDAEGNASGLDDFMTAVDKLWSGRSKGKCVIKVVE